MVNLLVFDDQNGHIKRSDKEIERLFKDILKNNLGLWKMLVEVNLKK